MNTPPNEGLEFVKDFRVIDLRSRIPVPEDRKTEKISPVTWTRYSLFIKQSMADTAVGIEFASSGADLDPRCLTHEARHVEVVGTHRDGDVPMKHTRVIFADIKEAQQGGEILVINEATYWNSFSGEDKDWAAMHVAEATGTIALVVIFPVDKPFKSSERYSYPAGSKRRVCREPTVLIANKNRQALLGKSILHEWTSSTTWSGHSKSLLCWEWRRTNELLSALVGAGLI